MSAHSYRDTLKQRGLQPFLWTQFLGAFNDNFFKFVVTMVAVHTAATEAAAGRNVSLVGIIFVAPFLLFSGYAGQLADVYSKRTVLVVTKSLEIVATALSLVAFVSGRLELTYVVLFLIAVQATFFSPAKYGILPEMLPERDLSRANGLLEMSTFVAIVAGGAVATVVFDAWRDRLWLVGVTVVAIAIVGFVASFGIPRVPAAAPATRIRVNPWADIAHGVRDLARDRVLCLTVIGLSYFWFLGGLLQSVMVLFGSQVLKLEDAWIGPLTASAAIGIGIGSLVAGRLSGDKVELGLAPIGAFGMGLAAVGLSLCTRSAVAAAVMLTLVGFSGGLFAVPLNALLQQRGSAESKGRLMATNNFVNMIAVALASGALWLCQTRLGMAPQYIIAVFAIVTLVSSVGVLALVPEFFVRFCLWLLTHTIYRIRIVGAEHVPFKGPALLVCNHMSHVDGFLIGSCVQRFIRFLVYRAYYEHWAFNRLLRMMHAIPIAAGSRREMVESIDRARQELMNGEVVCIFVEGSISRTGNLLPFKRGFERIADGLDVPVIPVYLDRVWGSIFSYKGGKFFWKLPVRLPYPVTVAFGAPVPAPATAARTRLAMMELGSHVSTVRRPATDTLANQFVRTAKRHWWSFSMADSTGRKLRFGNALVAGLLLSRWLRRKAPAERNIGLVLPASVGGALANIGTTLAGKVSVNLNFTIGREAMALAVERAEIGTIITSRIFLKKASLEPMDGMVFLEDVLQEFSAGSKLGTLVLAFLLPSSAISRWLVPHSAQADDLASVIFSSGSTGIPKGVMLTHRNILSNIESIGQVFDISSKDVLIGALPFFHSFGFTATLWFPLIAGFGVAYHANPMDAKTIGELAETYSATMLMATPTFCSAYIRKCEPKQFAHLRYAVVGAERLREPVARGFAEKFGLQLLEGYGCTEMSPVVAINAPNVDDGREHQVGLKPGSVGHPLPGVVAKIVDPETGEGPIFDREGLLLVSGPNRMRGYLGDEERTREALRDGWYVTGDIAAIDESGFITITDRLSRFSKIAGEMVPHMRVEEAIVDALGHDAAAVVTYVPDETKGERLVALYADDGVSPEELWDRLSDTELPRLWLPKRDDLHVVDAVPTLGTGKVDLRRVKQLALEKSGLPVT